MVKFKNTPVIALAIGLSLGATSFAQAQTAPIATPSSDDDEVSSVTVTGKKAVSPDRIPPDAYVSKSATCEYLAVTDPFFRTQLITAMGAGGPLMGPRLYQPTRPPRNPDKVTPLSPPDSTVPTIPSRWKARSFVDPTSSTEEAIDFCRDAYSTVGANETTEFATRGVG